MDTRFALLLACFFLSGFAALLYQTAWTRELSFVFGTSELAVAAVLAAYMGGLALGAAAAARYAMRLRRPVLAYGVLELAIALSALSVPLAIHLINTLYVALMGGGSELQEGGATLAIFQLAAAFAVLLPPTAFMGATLPLLARHAVRREGDIGRRVGVLYSINTAGAIAGTLCAAFWLMPELGLRHTVWVGAALNGLVFALAALLARGAAPPPDSGARAPRAVPTPTAPRADRTDRAGWILPAIALSGAVSFAYEVLWTRLLGQLLGGSLDAFATMLGSFLLGIALGSGVAARLATSRERAALGFAASQLGIAITSYGAFSLADSLPQLSLALGAGPGAPLASAAVAAAALLPITLCIGATFPFAVRLLARTPEQTARVTARLYAWNTVGAIVGALGAGFVLMPTLGFAGTVSMGIAANLALAAGTALLAHPRRERIALAAAAAGVVLLVLPAHPPWTLLSSSPLSRTPHRGEIVYSAVGRSATVLLFDQGARFRLTSNGLPEARIDRMGLLPLPSVAHLLGQLPSLLRPKTREMLVVGLGGGVVLESIPSSIESIDVIELEPEVLEANRRVASARAIDPLADPRVRVHLGDARGVLQLTQKRFDTIVSQPSHPWTAGASHLYTHEFFSLVRSRLKPDGVFVQWIGLTFVDDALLRSLAATLVDAFGHVEVYQQDSSTGVLFAASAEPLDIVGAASEALRTAPDDFARFGLDRVEDIAAARVLDDAGTRALSENAVLNTDDHNLLASRGSRLGDAALTGRSVRRLWKDHDPLLVGSVERLDRSALIRRLVEGSFSERATDLAMSAEGATEETELGWIELGLARPGRAARYFARALALDPGSRDAATGLVASRPYEFIRGKSLAGLEEEDLDEHLRVQIAAWRHASSDEWKAVGALDAKLGEVEPGAALFDEASSLRIRWRLAVGNAEQAEEALAIAERVLARDWAPRKALLRARAAIAADQPTAAWGSLSRIAEKLARGQRPAALVEQTLELAGALPAELAQDIRDRVNPRNAPKFMSGKPALTDEN